jgi:hypothetical protein
VHYLDRSILIDIDGRSVGLSGLVQNLLFLLKLECTEDTCVHCKHRSGHDCITGSVISCTACLADAIDVCDYDVQFSSSMIKNSAT